MSKRVRYKINLYSTPGRFSVSQLVSIEVQFIHMAQGGDGSAAMEGAIRSEYYPDWTDEEFQTVCNAMGWKWKA